MTEAQLEESVMEEDITERRQQIFETRRRTVRLEMGIAEAKKKIRLQTIENRVESTLDRLNYAKDSLNVSVARKIQVIEEKYTKERSTHEVELQRIDREEERYQANLRISQQDRLIFIARDPDTAQEQLIASIQANETEDQLAEDHGQDDEDEGEEDEGEEE